VLAAAVTRGVQSRPGCSVTVKHFVCNHQEDNRMGVDARVSERALRELYLRGFEIAVKESDPAFVMTSYNFINGCRTSMHTQLLKGVLRDEWGYQGAVMTDWRNYGPMNQEIAAGNNIKMPFGYPDQVDRALAAYYGGELSLAQLHQNATYVLNAVMKTRAFRDNDFGYIHVIDGAVRVPAIELNGLSNTRLKQAQREDGEQYIYNLFKDSRAQFTFLYYALEAPRNGEYTIAAEIRTNRPAFELWYYNERDERIGTASCVQATDEHEWYTVETTISLHKGENILKIVFADEPDKAYDFYGYFPPPGWDIHFAGFEIRE
jgi:beta-glucosidase-like glycosyl hydrolase